MSYLTGRDLCQQVIDKSERKQGLEYSLKNKTHIMRKTKLILFVLAFMMFGGMNAKIAKGKCGKEGKNITWVLDDDGTLTLSGSGEMKDYIARRYASWHKHIGKIKKVLISEGITSIGNEIFIGCENLTSVTIPNSVMRIGDAAFLDCKSLTSVTLPNSVTSIEEGAFAGCESLTSVIIPNSVMRIGSAAFFSCESLTSVTIPTSVTSIGRDAFLFCSSLTSIHVDSTNINYCAEDNVLFNKDKTELLYFAGGKAGSYSIPNTVTHIGRRAFTSSKGLTSVIIPNSVTSIGESAFSKCKSLTSVTIPNSVTIIEYKAFEGSGLTSVTLPNSITSIASMTFSNCIRLTSVTIPNSVTNIKYGAFEYCI